MERLWSLIYCLGICLGFQVRELENLLNSLKVDILGVHQQLSAWKNLGSCCIEMEEKLSDSEKILKLLQEQVTGLQRDQIGAQVFKRMAFLSALIGLPSAIIKATTAIQKTSQLLLGYISPRGKGSFILTVDTSKVSLVGGINK
ncbi:hypothetical protein SAY86_001072 [Trapa natans]|uniref:WIT1/2 N-terminal helical bundle domain-containing protein n=1 Tax=Trapa natans TaxID=22666 RepID=A0AAN7MBZ7_TRANT|nr:hypothetical protein SAY86_001072 [Trapa natans]